MYLLEATALEGLASALQGAIDVNTMLSNVTVLVPFVAGLVIFAFIFGRVRKSIRGASQGKAKI